LDLLLALAFGVKFWEFELSQLQNWSSTFGYSVS
jgi:hypothetical protein